ncbi:MAG: ABC transporter ATP-binding protein [Planctomycetota bacterium]
MANGPLLEITDLAVSFSGVRAVDGMSLTVHPRQTLALVGESGCGKTVTAMTVLQLVPSPPARIDRGSVRFEGRDLLGLSEKEMLGVRGGEIAMIFQEPMTSLNPVYTIGDQIVEAIGLHQKVGRKQALEIAAAAMGDVGIPDPGRRLRSYPHEFSGGMRQRAMIAMALACQPKLLLADEPSTALDVTIQAAENADVVCVMYAGRAVEYARVGDVFEKAYHPYTRGLLAAIPRVGDERKRLTTIDQVVGDPDEFRKLPDYDKGAVPWWPAMPPPDGLAGSHHGGDSVLCEVAPEHWVACWRTERLAGDASRLPDIDYRREEQSRGPD